MSENKSNVTALSTIKSWFKTGLKPAQAHFWAWMDSFYHKDEEIPQDKIAGLSKTLENKAEITAVEVKADKTVVEKKANLDASGLSEDNIISWKEALGVGELPSNIATIDDEEKQIEGNVYTKEKVDELLENSGKNMANTDLSITTHREHRMIAGSSLAFDTAGNPFQIKGLPDKSTDMGFEDVIKVNADGTFGKGKAFIFNVPETITVNNVGINSTPEVSEIVRQFKDKLAILHSSKMKNFDKWNVVCDLDDAGQLNRVIGNHTIHTNVSPFNKPEIPVGATVICFKTDKILPMNKDWAVRFHMNLGHDGTTLSHNQYGNPTRRIVGLFSGDAVYPIPEAGVYDWGGDYGNNIMRIKSSGAQKIITPREQPNSPTKLSVGDANAIVTITIMKVGDVILLQSQFGNGGISETYSASSIGQGDFGFCVSVLKPSQFGKVKTGIVSNVKYLIFD